MTPKFAMTAALVTLALLLGAALPPASAQTQANAQSEPVLAAIGALALINGQALACQDRDAARRAKALMLAHAPKTARFGSTFEDGTQRSYLATTQPGQACAEPAARGRQLDDLARQLQAVLPATPPATPSATPSTATR